MAPFVHGKPVVKFTPAEPPQDARRIIEGRCPTCGAELERRADDGFCSSCRVGWAYKTTGDREAEVTLTLEVDTSRWDAAVERSNRPRRSS